ncbi:MAG: putative ABC transporter ATP-binding protein [Candidatus Heimdallarchaeota archaeon LC_3]|nr:MAG: putative ABC transporter ATP-binding protein [Candidatus Heimdallarchaeota archaeon LC_3]
MTFVELQDVIKIYKPENEILEVPALRGIDLNFDESELVTIIGPSGSGKSTLIKIIGGIELPSSGTISVEGTGIINKLKNKDLINYRRQTVGFLYQFPEKNLLPSLSALENVMLPMRIVGKLPRKPRKQRALELLSAVGLANRQGHHLSQLSGGEAQRVSIAVSLANNPKIVLADEPTGELDSETTFKIIDYFKELNKNYGVTFIVVTHDERFALMTEKTYKIRDGRIYGLHRRIKSSIDSSISPSKREHLIYVDRQGNLRLPDEMRKEAKIQNHVVIRFDKDKGILEVIPRND